MVLYSLVTRKCTKIKNDLLAGGHWSLWSPDVWRHQTTLETSRDKHHAPLIRYRIQASGAVDAAPRSREALLLDLKELQRPSAHRPRLAGEPEGKTFEKLKNNFQSAPFAIKFSRNTLWTSSSRIPAYFLRWINVNRPPAKTMIIFIFFYLFLSRASIEWWHQKKPKLYDKLDVLRWRIFLRRDKRYTFLFSATHFDSRCVFGGFRLQKWSFQTILMNFF